MRKIAGYLTKDRNGKGQKIAQSTHENGYIKPRKTFGRNSKQFLSAVLACSVCGGIFFLGQSQEKPDSSTGLLLENIEALAVGENGSDCQGTGCVICPYTGDKVYMVDYYSLLRK